MYFDANGTKNGSNYDCFTTQEAAAVSTIDPPPYAEASWFDWSTILSVHVEYASKGKELLVQLRRVGLLYGEQHPSD
jgi:hypothetical protein